MGSVLDSSWTRSAAGLLLMGSCCCGPNQAPIELALVGYRACCDASGRPLVDIETPPRIALSGALASSTVQLTLRRGDQSVQLETMSEPVENELLVWPRSLPDWTGPATLRVTYPADGGVRAGDVELRLERAPSELPELRELRALHAGGQGALAFERARDSAELDGVVALWTSLEHARWLHDGGGDEALDAWKASADVARRLGVSTEQARRLRNAAFVALRLRRYGLVDALLTQANAVDLGARNPQGTAASDYYRGLLDSAMGQYLSAQRHLESAWRRARYAGDFGLACESRVQAAMISHRQHQTKAALSELESARECATRNGMFGAATRLRHLVNRSWIRLSAMAAGETHDPGVESVLAETSEALALSWQVGGDGDRTNALANHAYALWLSGQPGRARSYLEEALRWAPAEYYTRPFTEWLLAMVDVDLGSFARAEAQLLTALAAREDPSSPYTYRADAELGLAELSRRRGDVTAALEWLQRSLFHRYRRGAHTQIGAGRASYFGAQVALRDRIVALLLASKRESEALSVLDWHERLRVDAYAVDRRLQALEGPDLARWRTAVATFHDARAAQLELDAQSGLLPPDSERRRAESLSAQTERARHSFEDALSVLARREGSPEPPPHGLPTLAGDEGALAIHRVRERWFAFWIRDRRVTVVPLREREPIRLPLAWPPTAHLYVSASEYPDAAELTFAFYASASSSPTGTSVSHVPSLAWLDERGVRSGVRGAAAVLGDPTGDLVGARREAEGVASLLPHARIWLGEGATRTRWLRALREADVVHFAGHATIFADPWLEGLKFSRGSTGTQDILSQRNSASLVFLSACDTAAYQTESRVHGLSLADALLTSGVATVIASRRPLPDGESAEWVQAFYEALREHPAAEAARRASLAQKARGRTAWNAFVVFGARG